MPKAVRKKQVRRAKRPSSSVKGVTRPASRSKLAVKKKRTQRSRTIAGLPAADTSTRSLFLVLLLSGIRSAGLGIESGCLQHIDDLVSRVSVQHAPELMNPTILVKAQADFETFVARMIADARSKKYKSLHEDTFFAARAQCGLVFWCN